MDLGATAIRQAVARRSAGRGRRRHHGLRAAGGRGHERRAPGRAEGRLPVEIPGKPSTACGSGLQAVVHAAEALGVGYVDTIVAGGTESMSNAPYLLKGTRWGYRLGNSEVIDSVLSEGLTCAIAHATWADGRGYRRALWNFARGPGRVAAESQQRAGAPSRMVVSNGDRRPRSATQGQSSARGYRRALRPDND